MNVRNNLHGLLAAGYLLASAGICTSLFVEELWSVVWLRLACCLLCLTVCLARRRLAARWAYLF